MTLPYPYEAELGRLPPRPKAPRIPFDVRHHLEDAIRVAGSQLEFFGLPLEAPAAQGATAAGKQFRDTLTARFHARRPDADAATWEIFASQARAELAGLERADAETLRMLVLTVSGL
jgi:hypothetical protein